MKIIMQFHKYWDEQFKSILLNLLPVIFMMPYLAFGKYPPLSSIPSLELTG